MDNMDISQKREVAFKMYNRKTFHLLHASMIPSCELITHKLFEKIKRT
jgi:hypothetical protein